MKYFVILSSGAYSDYKATWYMGDKKITQEEIDKKGVELGDAIVEWYELLPEKENERGRKCKYDGDMDIWPYKLEYIWRSRMEEWLKNQGYQEIQSSAEVNIDYDLPTNRDNLEDF